MIEPRRLPGDSAAPAHAITPRHYIRSQIAGRFLGRHALAPADAMAFEPRVRDRRAFARFIRDGIVREVRPGHYYFDLPAYCARAERRRRAVVPLMIAIAVLLAGLATAFYQG